MAEKNKKSSPQRRKSAKGAHGGGHQYDEVEVDEEFSDDHKYLRKNKDEPSDKVTPKLNKDAGYNK